MFIKSFLLISDIRTIMSLMTLIIFFFILRKMEKKKVKFSKRMITGTLLGLLLGLIIQLVAQFPSDPSEITWMTEVSSWYGLVGNGFMDLLKMLVIPLVLISLIRVIMNMEQESLGKLAAKTIGMLLGTTLIASIIGMVLGSVFKLGAGTAVVVDDAASVREISTIIDTLRGLLPSNIVSAMAENNIVGVVIFATFLGLAIRRMKKKYMDIIEPFIKWVEASYKIIISVAMTIIKFMPYGVVALLATTIISRGVRSLADVMKFILAIYLGVFLMFMIHLVIASFHGVRPKEYLKSGTEPLLLAFTSRSSLGTLPVLIETAHEKFVVDEGIASFVGSIGANMGMNGCAGLYPALIVVMLGKLTGAEMNFSFFFMLAIIILIGSFGIVGLPGAATLAISVAVSGMGMSEYFYLVGAVIAIDPILDMGRTFLNVSGTLTTMIVVNQTNRKKENSNNQEEVE